MASEGSFFWYDLMTSDVKAAVTFYSAVVGWTATSFDGNDYGYKVLMAGETGVGGIMPQPDASQPPAWLGYIKAHAIDDQARAAESAGGTVLRQPEDIPGGVGRFAVIADPTGAAYMLLQPQGPEDAGPSPMTPGHIGWNEYMGADWEKAFAHYEALYGWSKTASIDMGEMGTYQLVALDGADMGGMMNSPPHFPRSVWGFYFIVDGGIDAAAARVVEGGGTVIMGPMQVPGGQWIVNAQDPQGAHFGLLSSGR